MTCFIYKRKSFFFPRKEVNSLVALSKRSMQGSKHVIVLALTLLVLICLLFPLCQSHSLEDLDGVPVKRSTKPYKIVGTSQNQHKDSSASSSSFSSSSEKYHSNNNGAPSRHNKDQYPHYQLGDSMSSPEIKSSWPFTSSSLTILFNYLPTSPLYKSIIVSILITCVPFFMTVFIPSQVPKTTMSLLLSFAVGAVLGDVFIHMLPEIYGAGRSHSEKDAQFHSHSHSEVSNQDGHHHSHSHSHSFHDILPGLIVLIGMATFFLVEMGMEIGSSLHETPGEENHQHHHQHSHSNTHHHHHHRKHHKHNHHHHGDDHHSTHDKDEHMNIKNSALHPIIS